MSEINSKEGRMISILEILKQKTQSLELVAFANDSEASIRIYEQADHILDQLEELGFEYEFDDDTEIDILAVRDDYEEEPEISDEAYNLLEDIQGNLLPMWLYAYTDECTTCGAKDYFIYDTVQRNHYRNTIQLCNCGERMDREQLDIDEIKENLSKFSEKDQGYIKKYQL